MRLAWIPVLLFAAAGCEDSVRVDAQAVVEKEREIDLFTPPAAWGAQVDALKTLSVHNKDMREVRDLCAEAHGALLSARISQLEAESKIATLSPRVPGEKSSPAALAAVEAIATSTKAVERATGLLPSCRRKVHELAVRFGSSRR